MFWDWVRLILENWRYTAYRDKEYPGLSPFGCLNTDMKYRKISNISPTKSQNLNDSHLVLKSSLPNPMNPGVKSRMKV